MAKASKKKGKAKRKRAELEEFYPFQFAMPEEVDEDDGDDEDLDLPGMVYQVFQAGSALPRLRIVSIVMDLDDPEQELHITHDEQSSRIEAYGMLDRARYILGPQAYGGEWGASE